MSIDSYLRAFKIIGSIVAAAGTLIPAYSFFAKLDPPILHGSGLITSASAAATCLIVYFYNPRYSHSKYSFPVLIKHAIKAFLVFIVMLVIYLVLLQWCTVFEDNSKERIQIGFGRAEWSLTEQGISLAKKYPNEDTLNWALRTGGSTETIWKPWTIYLSGSLMVLIFMFTFVLWTIGWALLAKHLSMIINKH